MSRSHDPLQQEARLEQQLRKRSQAPTEPGLAADWLLHNELKTLGPKPLSSELRHRLTQATKGRRFRFHSATGFALAASLLRQSKPDITAADARNFQLAIQTVGATSHRAVSITGRELSEHVRIPAIDLAPLPYSDLVRSIANPQPESEPKRGELK